MRLLELQRAFQAHVLEGRDEIAAEVVGTAQFDVATRLAVYAGGYAERLIEALTHTFPALRAALGEQTFGALVRLLAHGSPSRFASVREYGAALPELIGRELGGMRARGASELARWEWSLAQVFDAADAAPLAAADLQREPPERWAQLRFAPVPALRRVSLSTNAVGWWKAACAQGRPPGRWRATRPVRWVQWRRELALYFRPLAADESQALERLAAGETFAAVCSGLEPLRAAILLRGWVQEGWIAGASAGADN